MKRKRLISNILVITFLGLFAYYFANHTEDFQSLRNLNFFMLLVVMVGYIAAIYTNGLFLKLVIQPFNKYISHLESFRVALLSAIGNYFGPLLGGTGVRAVYLKKKVGLSYKDFILTLYSYYIIAFLINAILGLVALSLLYGQNQTPGFIVLGLFFSGTIIGLLVMIFNKRIHFIKRLTIIILGKRISLLGRLIDSWRKITSQPGLIKSLVKIALVNFGIFTVVHYFEFKLIGVNLGIGSLLLYTSLGAFSILISLTPGALGIREAIYLFSGSVMGVTGSQILAVALIDRTLQFVVMALGWIITALAKRWLKQDPDSNLTAKS